jgi:hypothetical protein
MPDQLRAIKALRLNYTRRGVWVWLKARHTYTDGPGNYSRLRGWQVLLLHPGDVCAEQEALAEGVM